MARTKTNTQNDTKTRTTSWRNRHLENNYIFVFLNFILYINTSLPCKKCIMISNNKNNNIMLLINCIHIGLGIGLRTARYDCPQPNDWVPERPKTRKAVDQKGRWPKRPYQKGRKPKRPQVSCCVGLWYCNNIYWLIILPLNFGFNQCKKKRDKLLKTNFPILNTDTWQKKLR